jgi:hypothetical protein
MKPKAFSIIDFETTSFHKYPKGAACQAAVRCEYDTVTKHTLINVRANISDSITKGLGMKYTWSQDSVDLHHIKPDMTVGQPTEEEVITQVGLSMAPIIIYIIH